MPLFFPYYDRAGQTINDGEVFTYHEFCKKKFGQRCINHYQKVTEAGFHECPYGFMTLATNHSLERARIYGSLVLVGPLNRKLKARGILRNKFPEEELIRFVSIAEQTNKKLEQLSVNIDQESDVVRGVFHEIRRLSRDLDDAGTVFQRISNGSENSDLRVVDNILQTIKLISIRVDSYELLKNPETITSGKAPNIKVYKKFDKSRYILTSKARQRGIHINFHNESYFAIDGYEIFDFLPYIVLDNAVKYSPDGRNVDVVFNDAQRTVSIRNLGPQLVEDEHSNLFKRGFRGRNSNGYQGSGLGLNLLKQICDLHDIAVSAKSDDKVIEFDNHKPFTHFDLILKFSTA